jgi:hypothetical protein
MASVAWDHPTAGMWRFSRRDAILVALTALHACVLALWPAAPVIALGVWWDSNTIAHNFIHRPFFRSAGINRLFSAALSVLLGIPQTLWRDRHLAHHAGVPWRLRISARLAFETALVVCLWSCMAALHVRFFLLTYLPGYLVGLGLCALQGHWEHAVGRPTSHYGRIYNFLCFNDGYHAEHHADPSIHWTSLPCRIESGAATSHWPPLLRWLEMAPLETLEQLVLRSPRLQRFVLQRHRKAFQALLPQLPVIRRAVIVGGGLFPRTALILREHLPAAHLTIVDSNPRNLETARAFLDGNIEFRTERYVPGESLDCDLTVIPMCLDGDRAAIYRHPPSPAVLVHDWVWHPHGCGAIVSVALLKRLNLVRQTPARGGAGAFACQPTPPLPAALFLVLLVAKITMLWGHAAPLSAWSIIAYTWQDAMVALAFAAFVILLQNRIAWLTYWAIAIYAAINIPVARVVFTPLTRPMLRAARGPLADSMLLYATAAKVMLILSVLAASAVLPLLLSRAPRPLSKLAILCLLPVLVLGPAASRRIDTRGMDRNAITALIGSSVPRAAYSPVLNDWRASPFPSGRAAEDLSRYAGAVRGFNVVMISLESTAAQYLALYGAQSDPMPNLTALARQALVFENAYAAYPESIKGLFSVLCPPFPHSTAAPKPMKKSNAARWPASSPMRATALPCSTRDASAISGWNRSSATADIRRWKMPEASPATTIPVSESKSPPPWRACSPGSTLCRARSRSSSHTCPSPATTLTPLRNVVPSRERPKSINTATPCITETFRSACSSKGCVREAWKTTRSG